MELDNKQIKNPIIKDYKPNQFYKFGEVVRFLNLSNYGVSDKNVIWDINHGIGNPTESYPATEYSLPTNDTDPYRRGNNKLWRCVAINGTYSTNFEYEIILGNWVPYVHNNGTQYVQDYLNPITIEPNHQLNIKDDLIVKDLIEIKANGVLNVFSVSDRLPNFCTTANRPVNITIGYNTFDTTLGYPIWYNGSNWVNASGSIV